ncbi:MAG: type II secretion system F family protein [Propionicimonas sp.]
MEWTVVASVAAGAAVLLWIRPPPAARLRKNDRRSRLPGWLLPVAHAMPAQQRGLVAGAVALAIAAWGGGLGWTGWLSAGCGGLAAFVLLGRFTRSAEARRREQVVAGLPETCDLLAVVVEGGLPLRVAVDAVAPAVGGVVGDLLSTVSAKIQLGVGEAQAWRELATEPGMEQLGREVARTVGGGIGLARLLRGLALDARREALAAAQVRAKGVGVRSVLPLMVCFLPAFVLIGIVPIIGGLVSQFFG